MLVLLHRAVLISLFATLFLVLFHYLSPWITAKLYKENKNLISLSAGTSVAYIFLEMLPNLVEYNKPIGEFLISQFKLSQLTELGIYIFTLIGFSIFYGLDLLAESKPKDNNRVYLLHLVMFSLYNFLITYTMSMRAENSLVATFLFTAIMALHFVLSDNKFCRIYQRRFDSTGRFILILALFIGWLFSVIFEPVNVLILAFLTSFLAGSILFNVFREEIPKAKLSSYPWFIAGLGIISVALLIYNILMKT